MKFQTIGLSDLEEQLVAPAEKSNVLLMLKQDIKQYEWSEGIHNIRLLPQPVGATESWTKLIKYCYLPKSEPGALYGYFVFTEEQAALNTKLQSYLYNSPWESRMKRVKVNPDGIDFGIKYRAIFSGFNYLDPDPKISPILLPANSPRPSQNARIQVGTKIKNFINEKDINGDFKYGDLVNLDSGRIIQFNITGEAMRREYNLSVDASAPMVDSTGAILPKYSKILDEVVPFEELINFQSDEKFKEMVMTKLPAALQVDIATRFFTEIQ